MVVNSQELRDTGFAFIKHVPELVSERREALDAARTKAEAEGRVFLLAFADDGTRWEIPAAIEDSILASFC